MYVLEPIDWQAKLAPYLASGEIGAGGSALMNGNTRALTELTEMIIKLYGYPAGFISQTGFLGLQTFETVALTFGPEKVQAILAKGAIHPSVYDPVKALKDARKIPRPMEFDPSDLESLRTALGESEQEHNLVFMNAVGSVDGFIHDIQGVMDVCEEMGAILVVDDAHGFLLGPDGKGTAALLEMEKLPHVLFGTFSKAAGYMGGIVMSTEPRIIQALNYYRSFMFTAAPGPLGLRAVQVQIEHIVENPEV